MAILESAQSSASLPEWLELVEGDSSVLLIAPHAGRAGEASRARLHPKVNDLHTREITLDLARRLNATALINHGMDRNRLDCNRLEQLVAASPEFLDLILERTQQIIDKRGHATVLLIHGWNIIEPRIDFGLGVRTRGTELRPAGAACVSACDKVINCVLTPLAARLASCGIIASFGYRYPGGAAQNLLQAFSERHLEHQNAAVQALSQHSKAGKLDAVQLELSVALRWPGKLREKAIEAIADAFVDRVPQKPAEKSFSIIRHNEVSTARRPPIPKALPTRFGVEFCDPECDYGVMASVDLGTGFGGRIMMLAPEGVILSTFEGKPCIAGGEVSLGPLRFKLMSSNRIELTFSGPAMSVPDPSSYVSIERALSKGHLEERISVEACFDIPDASNLGDVFNSAKSATGPFFGKSNARIVIGHGDASFDGVCRIGSSLSGLGNLNFVSRNTFWSVCDGESIFALEARKIDNDNGEQIVSARSYHDGAADCSLSNLSISGPGRPNVRPGISASVSGDPHLFPKSLAGGAGHTTDICISGEIRRYVLLSRPAPSGARIRTCIGFARYRLGESSGAGMFEQSSVFAAAERAAPAQEED